MMAPHAGPFPYAPWFGLALLVAVGALAAVPASSLASRPAAVTRGLDYLHAVQGSSGQFQDAASTPWAVIAIAASGENPDGAAWTRSGKSPIDYLQSLDLASYATRGATGNAAAYYAKMILAYVASGRGGEITSAGAGNVNLVARLLSYQLSDGRFSPAPSAPSIAAVNTTIWAIIALCAAETNGSSVGSAVMWLRAQQLSDGGFSSNAKDAAASLTSDVDDTAAAIEALVAGGVSTGADVLKDARAYLKGAQRSDGGFSSGDNGSHTYSESTAWAIQGILALGESPSSSSWTQNGRTPKDALAALQAADGAFQHKKGVVALPILSTTQAVSALSGRTFASFPRGRTSWVTPHVAEPRILRFTPNANAAVSSSAVTIRASYRDAGGGTGIARSGVRLVVDGRDKTGEATVGAASLSLRLTHPTTGQHTLKLIVRDRAGNARVATHTFTLSRGVASGTDEGGATAADGGGGSGAKSGAASGGAGSVGSPAKTAAGQGGPTASTAGTEVTPQGDVASTGTSGVTPTASVATPETSAAAAFPQAGAHPPTAPAQSPHSSRPSGSHRVMLVLAAVALAPLALGFGYARYGNRRVFTASEALRQTEPRDRPV